MMGLIGSVINLGRDLIKRKRKGGAFADKNTPEGRKVRNVGATILAAGGASYMLPPEFTEVVPEPWVTIVRGVLMIVGGIFAVVGQSSTEKPE